MATDEAKKDSEEWYVACSDEEVYSKNGYVKGKMKSWQPPPVEMVEILERIDKNEAQSLRLDWTCPGRRPPTPSTESEYSDSDDEAARLEAKAAKDFDFDADEDMNMTPMARKSLPGSAKRELKGSARKRTTDLKSILSSMERHRKMGEAEQKKSAAGTPSRPTSAK